MFLPFLPLILASLGLSLLVLPMLPDEAVIPLEPIETLILLLISSLLLGQAVSIKKFGFKRFKMGCRTLDGFELGHPVAY